ncbi:hypothetical protein [Falsihalocynthiibacter arcticus]|uniref:hypothetical protein n=1 Tax=Falsihalocynthiibacter arcticus TaxID=1579316 RepID=UPI001470361E|nr:hypothetical protein [Falsihalocynthiibacter arcticus]
MQLCDQFFHPVTAKHANGTGTAGDRKQWGAVVGFEMAQPLKAGRGTAHVAAAPCDCAAGGACVGRTGRCDIACRFGQPLKEGVEGIRRSRTFSTESSGDVGRSNLTKRAGTVNVVMGGLSFAP